MYQELETRVQQTGTQVRNQGEQVSEAMYKLLSLFYSSLSPFRSLIWDSNIDAASEVATFISFITSREKYAPDGGNSSLPKADV